MQGADPVNHPKHYTGGDIECIDAMVASQGKQPVTDFCICNAFKYLWRFRGKNGVEDLQKARWYIDRAISMIGDGANDRNKVASGKRVAGRNTRDAQSA